MGENISGVPQRPRLFFGGNEFWKTAAGIEVIPIDPRRLEPQNYPELHIDNELQGEA